MTAALIETRQLARAALLEATDFHLYPGDRVAITGDSGSGKSVFLRLLALLDAPSSGEVRWHGQPVISASIPAYRASVCYLAQRAALVEGTVLDNLKLPFSLKVQRPCAFDPERLHTLLARAGKPAAFLDKPGAELSGGEAQIVALIRALLVMPQVLLLDEPTSALDPQSATTVEALVMDWLDADASARACVWVSHDHAQARRMATRQLRMVRGALHSEVPA